MNAEDGLIGEVVGRWRVVRLIGAGGMGRVYEAVQPEIGARVAIKVLRREAQDDKHSVERFFTEARAVNVARHENIVEVIDLARLPDGTPYIVMEYLDGASLAAIFRRGRGIALGALARLVGEVLAALEVAHAHGIVHRDLKPDNVFVSPSGRVKVLDFGIAKLVRDAGPTTTQTGMLLGTPAYMAPEQARSQAIDARTDLYAAGVILYEGATGAPPFAAANLFDLLKLHVEAAPAPPRERNPALPEALEAVILRSLAKEPADRFGSAREMRDALARAAVGLSVPALDVVAAPQPPADPLGETAASTQESLARGEPRAKPQPRTRSPAKWAIGGAVATAALAAGAWWLFAQPLPLPLPQPLPLPLPQPLPLPLPRPPAGSAAAAAAVKPPPPPKPKDDLVRNKDGTYVVPWNLHSFDLRRTYSAMAAFAARVAGARVEPYMLSVDNVDASGRPLAKFTADFQFISTAAAHAGRRCLYNVAIRGTTAYLDAGDFENHACDAPGLGAPRCSWAALMAAAHGNGLPADSTDPISIVRNTPGQWNFMAGPVHLYLDDDCD